MALAPLAHVLWTRVMKYDATDPDWPDRDRFVLSDGHASMLLYSMLYLTGFGLELDDLREFRQWGSRTPGHPEYGHTNGVEVTTGPLGQGIANAVGIAIAEKHLRARFGAEVCDHRVFGICGDGDLMEGISHEAASLAGHLQLGRLVFVYDDNHITIDGDTELAYSDDVPKRFEAYGWHVVQLGEVAKTSTRSKPGCAPGSPRSDRPSLIVLRSHIGYPSPKVQDTAAAHGNPLGADEVARVKEILGLPAGGLLRARRRAARATARRAGAVPTRARVGGAAHRVARREPGARRRVRSVPRGRGRSHGWEQKLPTFEAGDADRDPRRERGGADRGRRRRARPDHRVGRPHRQHRHGGEEPRHDHARATRPGAASTSASASTAWARPRTAWRSRACCPCVGTFFVFSDYMRPAVRLAAIMQTKVCFVWTHDSVGVGEDGPTHEPVEQLASLRAMPGLRVIRPGDANEVAAAWQVHLDGDGPTALILTRQKIPVLEGTAERAAAGVAARRVRARRRRAATARPRAHRHRLRGRGRGRGARRRSPTQGVAVRVVSMPSWDLFEEQPDEYRVDGAAARRADARGRGRRALRLGALRRRRREHRSLRRVGAGRRRHARARDHARARRSSARSRCSTPVGARRR